VADGIDEEIIRESFRNRDRNGDGVLTPDEMTGSLRDDLVRWDKNGDGKIDLEEYKDYYRARMQAGRSRGSYPRQGGFPAAPQQPAEEGHKPVVYRVGNLPKGLPAWFTQLDRDKDGQVGLYEWKQAGRSLGEFRAMDQNGDGFLTAEEVLRHQKRTRAKAKASGPPVGPRPGER
jgi:Ca2+-binding EF-hand superfamily protein